MATQTSLTTTSASTAVVGMREDLSDIITRTDPAETVMVSWFGRGTATHTTAHEWETVSLRAPRRSPKPEGNQETTSTAKVAVRMKNACEIISEQYAISGSVEAADVAGAAGKMEFQRLHKGLELRKDLELAVIGPQGYVTSDPREMGGVIAYASTYTLGASGGTAPGAGTNAGNTDVVFGVEQALDTDLLNTQLQAAWIKGAQISLFNLSSAQKLAFDNAVPVDSFVQNQVDLVAKGVTVATTVAIWRSTWGDIKFVMNRVMDEQGGWGQQVIQGFDERSTYRPKICPLPGRDWGYDMLGKIGDLKQELMLFEGTVEIPNPNSIITVGGLSDAYAS